MTLPDQPSSQTKDTTAAIIKGVVSAIPIVGGLISEVGNIYLNPLERRKQEWMQEVASAIQEIQGKYSALPENLQKNERFISFLYQATIIALKNHQKEKLRALRGALISAADPNLPSEDVALQFLRYVDELTPTHLHILSCLSKHIGQFARVDSLEQVLGIFGRFSSLKLDRIEFRLFVLDLDARFLIQMVDLKDLPEFASRASYVALQASARKPFEVTSLGRQFLEFVQDQKITPDKK